MAKKKSKEPAAQGTGSGSGPGSTGPTAKSQDALPANSSTSYPASFVISRNKHWRHLSSFHGNWLSLPVEVLETLANFNYYMPCPRPIEPAVFYDLVKIRQLVDDATDLSVRAASGHFHALGSGGTKLSSDRRFKMHEQATQKLARAYRLDEIACSVTTMQHSSTLENVADMVLKRAHGDFDATYVHFFHEKIPSRQLASSTDLGPLDQLVTEKPYDCEPLRTRAFLKACKNDLEGAAGDLTSALAIDRSRRSSHRPSDADAVSLERRPRGRRDMPPLDEKDQPSSMEWQLLFQRADCYLSLACRNIEAALPTPTPTPTKTKSSPDPAQKAARPPSPPDSADGENPSTEPSTPNESPGPTEAQLGHRKSVRLYAKRALRDYMEYLKHFHYSPDFPSGIMDDFIEQSRQAKHYQKIHGRPRWNSEDTTSGHKMFNLADLFAALPPTDLPAFPSNDPSPVFSTPSEVSAWIQSVTTQEIVTYHPLLTDALHSLLLCHTLIQTSAKELQRHAHMVARLTRLATGYPVFGSSKSAARGDWIEMLCRTNNWIGLATDWETLCMAPTSHRDVMKFLGFNDMQSVIAALEKAAIAESSSSQTGFPQNQGCNDLDGALRQLTAITEAREDGSTHSEAYEKSLVKMGSTLTGQQQVSSNNSHRYPGLPKDIPSDPTRVDRLVRWVQEAPAGSGVVSSGKRKKKAPGGRKVSMAPVDGSVGDSNVQQQQQ